MDSLVETVRQTYRFLDQHDFKANDPEAFFRVAGTTDIHVHAGPSRQPYLPLARHASRAGMRAMVWKDHGLGSTVDVAAEATETIQKWGRREDCETTAVFGSVIIRNDSPSDWASFVTGEVERGAKVVWLPVWDAVNHLVHNREIEMSAAAKLGLSVLEGDRLSSQASELLEAVAAADVALSFGHLSKDEMVALSERCSDLGIEKAFVDHPFSPASGLDVSDMVNLAARGVTMNFTYWELSPYCGVSAVRMSEAIREIGVESCMLSSDSGLDIMPNAVECMRLHMAMLDAYAFTDAEMRALGSEIPARHLSLDLAS